MDERYVSVGRRPCASDHAIFSEQKEGKCQCRFRSRKYSVRRTTTVTTDLHLQRNLYWNLMRGLRDELGQCALVRMKRNMRDG